MFLRYQRSYNKEDAVAESNAEEHAVQGHNKINHLLPPIVKVQGGNGGKFFNSSLVYFEIIY